MAGRGTDIQLGGNVEMQLRIKLVTMIQIMIKRKLILKSIIKDKKKVIEAGGLYVLATERHRVEGSHQLRGRSGRQGDPGKQCFF